MTRSAARVLGKELEGVVHDASLRFRRDADRATDDAQDTLNAAALALARAAESLTDEVRAQAQRASRKTARDIRRRPLAALGTAAAAGLMVGLLVGRRT